MADQTTKLKVVFETKGLEMLHYSFEKFQTRFSPITNISEFRHFFFFFNPISV